MVKVVFLAVFFIIAAAYPSKRPRLVSETRKNPDEHSRSESLYDILNNIDAIQSNLVSVSFDYFETLYPAYFTLRTQGIIFILFYLIISAVLFKILFRVFARNRKADTKSWDKKIINEIEEIYTNTEIKPEKQHKNSGDLKENIEALNRNIISFKDSLLTFQSDIFESHSTIWKSLDIPD
jgi:deoxyadenosine/deoxycytidine kinase